jgi:hypothetical protein
VLTQQNGHVESFHQVANFFFFEKCSFISFSSNKFLLSLIGGITMAKYEFEFLTNPIVQVVIFEEFTTV